MSPISIYVFLFRIECLFLLNVILILSVLLFTLVEKSKVSTTTFSVETNNRKGFLVEEKILC
jgi:hypothetical protein